MVSGVIFDKLFNGKRAPVAAPLFLFQAVLIEVAQLMSSGKIGTTLQVSVTVPMGIHVGCDATHSRLGTGVGKGLGWKKGGWLFLRRDRLVPVFWRGVSAFLIGRLMDRHMVETPEGEKMNSAV